MFFPKLGIETVLGARTRWSQPSVGLRLPFGGSSSSPCTRMAEQREAGTLWRCETRGWGRGLVSSAAHLLTGLAPLSAPGSCASPLCLCDLSSFYLFIYLYFILFIFGCIRSSLLSVGFLYLQRVGATLCCRARASHCGGFSCCGARAPGARASVVVACGLSSCGSRAPEHRLSSCGAWAQLLRGMWDPPGPGLELVSPALVGRFPTTVPPGKPDLSSLT